MSDLAFLAVTFGIVWLALFGYLFSLSYRERELRREVKVITEVLREREMEAAAPAARPEARRVEAPSREAPEPSAAT